MFCKDSRVENMLTQFGVTWKWSNNISFDKLAPNWENKNNGRSKPRDEEVILEYAARSEAGSSPPGAILHRQPQYYDILDGIQRLCSEQLRGVTSFSGYVVETDSKLLATKIRVLANHLLGGHPEPGEWTRRRAVQLFIIENGMSIKEVAELGGWKEKDVFEDWRCMDTGFKIRSAGGPEQLPKGILLTISDHAKPDDFTVARVPVAEFCSDLKKAKFSNGESEPHIKEFFGVSRNSKKSLHDQFSDRLEKFRADPEVQLRLEGRQPQRRKHDIKLRGAMKAVVTITEELLEDNASLGYMDEFFQIWNQVEGNLKKLSKLKLATR